MRHLLFALCLAGCSASPPTSDSPYSGAGAPTHAPVSAPTAAPLPAATPKPGIKVQESKTGLRHQVLKEGKGKAIANGQLAKVHYTGRLTTGSVFDSSKNREPIEFVLGEGRVIPGWEEGILGMKAGEQRMLYIPSVLAYGDNGFPPVIPPKAELVFEVELVGMGPLPEGKDKSTPKPKAAPKSEDKSKKAQ